MAWYWHLHRPMQWFGVSGVSAVLLIAICYALINAHWSLAKEDAYAYVAMLLVVLICLHVGLDALARLRYRAATTAMAVGFCVGFILAG
jgi:hypothetical protein